MYIIEHRLQKTRQNKNNNQSAPIKKTRQNNDAKKLA